MFSNRIVQGLAKLDLSRNLLRRMGQRPQTFRFLNRLSMPTSVYPSFEEAREASRKARPVSHEQQEMIAGNFELSLARRPSDYPVLFWLADLARRGPLRVIDFGGGAGQCYYQYRALLGGASIADWVVIELPAVVEYGRRLATERGARELRFIDKLGGDEGHNVLLAAGSIHYWEGAIAELGSVVGRLPDQVIINRSPFRSEPGSFITVQQGSNWAVPCLVRNLEDLSREFGELGYRCVDSWRVLEKSLEFPFMPQYQAPYQGVYYSRATA